jgi:hypothetical protein
MLCSLSQITHRLHCYAGECGLRGGYVEFSNFHPGTIEEMYKIASSECFKVSCR